MQSSSLMSELVSFPVLLQHEEALTKQGSTMYDVTSWMLYITEVDSILESMRDTLTAAFNTKKKRAPFVTIDIGGRSIPHEKISEASEILQKARNLISERSLSLLPGSYKLWHDYLKFRSEIYMNSSTRFTQQTKCQSYAIFSSPHSRKYNATLSAYERSLVRMNKYPRIWLSYISFVVHNDPSCSVINVRRIFNRALLALPATQHDLIWSEYLCYILGKVPPKGLILQKGASGGKAMGNLGPIVRSYKSGTLSKLSVEYPVEIPQETALRVLRRYARYYNPSARELLAVTALKYQRYGEAASLFCEILNDADFLSVEGTTRHELWMKLADICTEHPGKVIEEGGNGVNFEVIVRAVLKPPEKKGSGFGWETFDDTKNTDEGGVSERDKEKEKKEKVQEQQAELRASLGEMEGTLWTKLAHYQIRNGEFELARSIYEEAMESVSKVRDFSLIFDGYIKFEEGVIEAMMEVMNEEDKKDGATNNEDRKDGIDDDEDEDVEDMDILLGNIRSKAQTCDENGDENSSADIELALARAENLMGRRPLLLNRVLLRQNPHNVDEWLKRSDLNLKLYQLNQAIAALEEAVKKVNCGKAVNGSPATLYTTLASLHESHMQDVASARSVFERICCPFPEYQFRGTDDLAQCYSSWVEMELRNENWDQALSVARRSVAHVPAGNSNKIARSLFKSLRLWNLLLDLEESLGTIQTTKDAYNRAIELKVVTPSHIINFASFLTEKKYYEESFTAYERGVDLFTFPNSSAKLLWKEYLQSFENRYGGTKIHRIRELFDRCLDTCPPEDSSEFFISYGRFEEEHGLTKRALGVYERMCTIVPEEEKHIAYQLYIAKTVQYIGITATRPLYERAIVALQDAPAARMCCDFAKMEASLQEIDRARTAFTYGAQLADPRRAPEYWEEWHEFEVSYGNEETFREMLRIKRGVQAAFSTVNYNAAEMGAGVPKVENLTDEQALEMIAVREGVEVNDRERIGGFVQAKRTAEIKDLDEVERRAAKLRKVTAGLVAATQERPVPHDGDEDEIDLEDDDNDNNPEDAEIDPNESAKISSVSTKPIPVAVFGGIASQIVTASK